MQLARFTLKLIPLKGKTMKRKTLVVVACAILCACVAPASAAVTLAEFSFDTAKGSVIGNTFYPGRYMMQTFTTSTSGTVGSVEVAIQQLDSNATAGLTVGIYNLGGWTINGLQPTGSPLSTGALAATDPQFDDIFAVSKHIAMSPVALTKGSTYGLVVYAGGSDSDYSWVTRSNGTDMYNAGEFSVSSDGVTFAVQPNQDVCFSVLTPEPATVTMLLATGAGLIMRRRTAAR